MPPADPPHARKERPPLWRRALHVIFDPAPPWYRTAALWWIVCLPIGMVLANAPMSSGSGAVNFVLTRAGEGPWDVRYEAVPAGAEQWTFSTKYSSESLRAHRVTFELVTTFRADAAGAPLPPPSDAEILEARRAVLSYQGDGPWMGSIPSEHRDRVRAFLRDSTDIELVIWTPQAVLLTAAAHFTAHMFWLLPAVGLVRIIRRRRISRRLRLATSHLCPACGYDLSASFPRLLTCPECNADYRQQVLHLERLIGLR